MNATTASPKRSILLVEEDQTLRMALSETLRFLGYRVYEAPNGAVGLEFASVTGVALDLVISDLMMPGINALELYEGLGPTGYAGKFLILTGYPMPNSGQTLAEKPGVVWHRKPIGVENLRTVVEGLLGE